MVDTFLAIINHEKRFWEGLGIPTFKIKKKSSTDFTYFISSN